MKENIVSTMSRFNKKRGNDRSPLDKSVLNGQTLDESGVAAYRVKKGTWV